MNPNRNNGWQSGAESIDVADRSHGGSARINEDPFASIQFDDEGDKSESQESKRQRSPRRHKRLVGALILLALVGGAAGFWILSGGGKTRITVPVRDNTRNDAAPSRNSDDVTAQAIAEVRSAIAAQTPSVSSSPQSRGAGTAITGTTPVTMPREGAPPATNEAATGQRGDVSAASAGAMRPGGLVSERNPERSIRCAPTPSIIPARFPNLELPTPTRETGFNSPALLKRSEPKVALPPFGSLLPVRTLGAIYTLRQSMARFELLRDVRGDGWRMKKGTLLVGQQQGSEYNRAYISLLGMIDPESKRFVKLTGEILGADGAPGLKGKRKEINSRWTRVLARAATGAVSLGQAALARGNSTTVVLPGAIAPELSLSSNIVSRREFVEVPAAAPAFVMITNLPIEAKGMDAEPGLESNGQTLADEELAQLMESGSPEKIRAAMPRMSPELRRIAEKVLKEQNQ
jgi:hypothetical protein